MNTCRQYLGRSSVVTLFLLTFVSSVDAASTTQAENAVRRLDILIGTSQRISVSGPAVTKVEVSDTSVLTARVGGDSTVSILALKKGLTSLTVWQGENRYTDYVVVTWNVLPDNIRRLVQDIPGVQFIMNGSKITFAGKLLIDEDKERISKIAAAFAEDIDDVTFVNLEQFNREALALILREIGNPQVSARFAGSNLVLTGKVHRQEDKDRAAEVARAYVGENGSVSNSIEIIDLPVEIDVAFVQLTRSTGHEIGADEGNLGILQGPSLELNPKVNVGDAIGSSLQVGNIGYGLANQTLRYLETNGQAKVFWRPYVRTNSGRPGRIQQGGEIGIRTTTATGAGGVDYKEYGLILDTTPVVGPDYSLITLEMALEVSQPIRASGGADVELQKFSTSTYGNVKLGETLVVSGLRQVVRERVRNSVPIIGQVPVLDLIFARDEQSEVETDIVVLLTPYLPTVKTDIMGPAPSERAPEHYDSVNDDGMTLR